jgi:hypothetical protein
MYCDEERAPVRLERPIRGQLGRYTSKKRKKNEKKRKRKRREEKHMSRRMLNMDVEGWRGRGIPKRRLNV